MYGWMNGWIDYGQMDGEIMDRRMERSWIDGWRDYGRMDGSMESWIDGWLDNRVDERTDGWVKDGWMV